MDEPKKQQLRYKIGVLALIVTSWILIYLLCVACSKEDQTGNYNCVITETYSADIPACGYPFIYTVYLPLIGVTPREVWKFEADQTHTSTVKGSITVTIATTCNCKPQ